MALEAVVYQQDFFGHNNGRDTSSNNLNSFLLETWAEHSQLLDHHHLLHHQNVSSFDANYLLLDNNNQSETTDWHYYCYDDNNNHINDCDYGNNVWDYSTNTSTTTPMAATTLSDDFHQWAQNSSSSPEEQQQQLGEEYGVIAPVTTAEVEVSRTKRRRARAKKNKEDIENQRMTHIAVERNRRKQMNDYLSVLRNLMPNSYVQRGDQASIIGGAINFVKELEQNLQCLSAQKHTTNNENHLNDDGSTSSLPFGEFFAFPQYSTTGRVSGGSGSSSGDSNDELTNSTLREHQQLGVDGGGGSVRGGSLADVEVTMVESHALVKIRTKRPPKQLSKLVCGLQSLRLTILHLNVTKVDGVGLFSFSVKVEDESKLNCVDEIAGAVYQLLGRIQEETAFNC